MSRLINLDAAVDVTAKWFENMGLNGDICLDGLRSLPSVQPEIIRCWNCKHFIGLLDEKSAKKYGQEYECECGRLNKPEPDDFCSRPAPKENR